MSVVISMSKLLNVAVVTVTSMLVEPTTTVVDSASDDCLTMVTGCCTVVMVTGGPAAVDVVASVVVVVVVVDVVGEVTKLVNPKQTSSWLWQFESFFKLHNSASVVHCRISIRFSTGFARKFSGRMSSPSPD